MKPSMLPPSIVPCTDAKAPGHRTAACKSVLHDMSTNATATVVDQASVARCSAHRVTNGRSPSYVPHSFDERVREHREVRALEHGPQEAFRNAPTHSAALR